MLVSFSLVLVSLVATHPLCVAKRPVRPGLFQPSRLVVEFSKVVPCPEPDNGIVFYNIRTGMISKVDFSLSLNFNITRSARAYHSMLIKITKCRESVSSNNCELFQTWRFDKEPCKGLNDPAAPWSSAMRLVKPRPECPLKPVAYRVDNLTIGTSVLEKIPLPWEGNVWLIRLGMMDTKTRFHMCSDVEMHVHRVRDG